MKVHWPQAFPGAHWFDEAEERAVLDVLRSGAPFRYYGLRKPKHVEALEAAAKKLYGVEFALGVGSGTGALMTAMTALGLGPGQEVIVPSFFWVSTVGAVVHAGAIPVLCEVDDSFCMDPRDLERKITARTGLILPVHMAGAVCDMRAILAVARRHGVPVLEDCAQANGGEFRGRKVGTFGTMGIFSLQLNKNVTAGEGGLIVTNDARLYERAVSAHDLGIPWKDGAPQASGPESVTWGAGRRMGELVGAVARVQLRKLPGIIRRMRASKQRIKKGVEGLPGVSFRRLNDEKGDTGSFLILILDGAPRALEAVQRLKSSGVDSACRIADYGMHVYHNVPQLVGKVPLSAAGNPWSLPWNRESPASYSKGACPRSDDLFERSVVIPVPSCLSRDQETAAAKILREAVA